MSPEQANKKKFRQTISDHESSTIQAPPPTPLHIHSCDREIALIRLEGLVQKENVNDIFNVKRIEESFPFHMKILITLKSS